MQIRDTEGVPTSARNQLFGDLGVVDIQGVTMTSDWEPTACVEAIDYTEGEEISPVEDLRNIVGSGSVVRKLAFAEQLGIPLYVITSVDKNNIDDIEFTIFEIVFRNGNIRALNRQGGISADNFANFWSKLKGTKQTKPLPDARIRIQNSNVDQVIEEVGLSWGGNVDGVLLDSDKKVKAIIEARKTNYTKLSKYDPGDYFHEDYNTWKPLFIMSGDLGVPLILLTFEEGEDRCGFAILQDYNKTGGLIYNEGPPYANLLSFQEARTRLTNM